MESTGGGGGLKKGGLVSEEMGKALHGGYAGPKQEVVFPDEVTENQPGKTPSSPRAGLQLTHHPHGTHPPTAPNASTKLQWPGQWVIS